MSDYPNAPFPLERLVVKGGGMGASAHKNDHNPLHLDWDFSIAFEPVCIGGENHETSLHVEIETKGIWRLADFAGMTRHDTTRDFNIGSFYLLTHRAAVETRFKVHSVQGTKLDVEVEMLVDLGDSYVDPAPPQRVHVRAELTFRGIMVSSYGVQSEADTGKLMAVAAQLFDPSTFPPPRQLPDHYQKGDLNLFFDPPGKTIGKI
jgi:hypothetical protein